MEDSKLYVHGILGKDSAELMRFPLKTRLPAYPSVILVLFMFMLFCGGFAEDLAANTIALFLPAAAGEVVGPSTPVKRLAAAREKYNAETVNVYVRGKGKVKKGKINVCFSFSKKKQPICINIRESLQINDPYEMQAVLEVITANENYDETVYGSVSFMKAQWITHNVAHGLATGESRQLRKWVETVAGRKLSSVIKSAKVLDLSPIERIPEREMKIYLLVERVYRNGEPIF